MKYLFQVIIIIGLLTGTVAFAAPTSTIVQNLFITAIPNLNCLGTNGSGLVGSGTCSGGAGGSGSVSTSSPITINSFPYWTSVGGGLSGTSTLTLIGTTINSSGTITINGQAVLTASPATTTINGVTAQTFTIATSSPITFAPSGASTFTIACPSCLTSSTGVTTFNGNSGAVNGVSSLNLTYGDLSLVVRASGTVPTIEGGGAPFYINFPAQGSQIYAPSSTIVVGAITTSTWVINASGTNIFTNNQGGSSTIWVSATPTFTAITDSGITSALVLTGSGGLMAAYAGASACAGRGAVTTISALGATTCSTSVGISTSTANLWTALQEFSNVSTTQLYSASTTLTGINSSIIWSNATGKLGSYGGTGCGTGSAIATLNSSGTATCATITGLTVQSLPSSTSWLAGQLLFGLTGGTASSSALVSLATSTGILTIGSSTITNLNASIASTSLETVNQLRSNSSTLSGVTTAANVSSTNIDATNYMRIGGINVATSAVTSALLSAGAGGALSAFGGSGPCTAGQYTTQISALGVLSCASAVVSLGGQAGTITVDNTLSIGAGKILSVATSSLGSITLTSSTTTNVTFTNATGTNLTIGKMLDNSGNQYVTSSAQYPIQWTVGNEVGGQQDGIFIFSTTSTIRSCLAGNVGRTVGNSNVFNLGFTTSTANATSSWNKLFSTDQNIITNGTTTSITVNASTTWSTAARSDSIPYQLGYYSDTASSSEFTVTCFATTP